MVKRVYIGVRNQEEGEGGKITAVVMQLTHEKKHNNLAEQACCRIICTVLYQIMFSEIFLFNCS